MTPRRVMTVFGTRPEAIKVAPVIQKLEQSSLFDSIAVSTGQHREMLDQVTELFGLVTHMDLNIIQPRQTLVDVSVRSLEGVTRAIEKFEPDALVVQGDTTTSTFAALAAFYQQVPVVHLEAGLRTGNLSSPFPEEANRKLTSQIAALHLAPTPKSKQNLLAEGVAEETIHVTGNTVIDALHATVAKAVLFENPRIASYSKNKGAKDRTLLVTAHRRESLGDAMEEIGRALAELSERYSNLTIVFPIHKNPAVRDAILPKIESRRNVIVTEPLSYGEFTQAMQLADIVLTDSGGVQEEAPSLGKPVLVMRDTTERPEAVAAGTVKLVGADHARIVGGVAELIEDPAAYAAMAQAVNPYGDGLAADRTVAAISSYFKLGEPMDDFK